MDVKCPNSGEHDSFHMQNLDALDSADEVKFVFSDRTDYEFARDFVARHHLARRVTLCCFHRRSARMPGGPRDSSHCLLDPRELAEWMLADNVPARLGLQIHKFIWDPAMKSV